jgi:hypothetical protein
MAQPLDLCEIGALKRMIGIEDEQAKDDSLLNLLIRGVSAQIQRWLGRTILSGTYTEYHDVNENQSLFAVSAWPVTAVTSVVNAADWTWSATTAVDSSDIHYAGSDGIIALYAVPLVVGARALRIIYTGGMAANTEELANGDYSDVSMAALQQCVAVWNNRRYFGVSGASAGAASVSPNGTKLLDSVKELLAPHRRQYV